MSKLSAFSGKLTDSGFCQNSVTAIIHVDSSTGKKGNCEEGVFFFLSRFVDDVFTRKSVKSGLEISKAVMLFGCPDVFDSRPTSQALG